MAISVEDLTDLLSDVQVSLLGERASNGRAPTASAREIYRNYQGVIPRAVKSRLAARTATGDRSRVLWKLTCALLEAGLTPGEVVVLVEKSVWNKFEDDRSRLWSDVNKAASRIGNQEGTARPAPRKSRPRRDAAWSTPLDRYLAVESRDPQWMVEGLWSDKSHGIVAGEPKTRKSYVAIDIALSVATGTDCLGYFPVKKAGPVLMVQEEVSDAEMRKRLRYIAASKELGGKVEVNDGAISVRLPEPVPLFLRNRKQFDLSDDDSYRTLEREVKDKDISLLILDPLQLMLGDIDENKSSSVRPMLYNFLQLKEVTGCGIMIIHHYSKASEKNPKWGGQRMLGSQALHGWVESALYLERTRERKSVTRVEREFRNFDAVPDFEIDYVGGDEAYEVAISEEAKERKRKPPTTFEQLCMKNDGASVKALAKHFEKSDNTIRKWVEKSAHVMLAKGQPGPTGRAKVIVVRRRRG